MIYVSKTLGNMPTVTPSEMRIFYEFMFFVELQVHFLIIFERQIHFPTSFVIIYILINPILAIDYAKVNNIGYRPHPLMSQFSVTNKG